MIPLQLCCAVLVVCLLASSQAFERKFLSPKTINKQHIAADFVSAIGKTLPFAVGILGATIPAVAAEQKGKLEYQPILQGLDYGKVRKSIGL